MRKIDNKFHIENEQIIKTSNGETIPDDEPLFLLRGRDYLAMALLKEYEKLCIADGCTKYQVELLSKGMLDFWNFRLAHPERMKQPGITKGL